MGYVGLYWVCMMLSGMKMKGNNCCGLFMDTSTCIAGERRTPAFLLIPDSEGLLGTLAEVSQGNFVVQTFSYTTQRSSSCSGMNIYRVIIVYIYSRY